MTRYCIHSLLPSAISNIRPLSCLTYRSWFFRQPPLTTVNLLANVPSRRQGNSDDSRTSGLASINVPVSARAARICLILGNCDTEIARLISQEKADGASSINWLSLEYILLQLSSLPQGCISTAGKLEKLFDFLILVGMYAWVGHRQPYAVIPEEVLPSCPTEYTKKPLVH